MALAGCRTHERILNPLDRAGALSKHSDNFFPMFSQTEMGPWLETGDTHEPCQSQPESRLETLEARFPCKSTIARIRDEVGQDWSLAFGGVAFSTRKRASKMKK